MMEDSEEGASQLHSLRFTPAKADAAAEYMTTMFLVCAWPSVNTQLGECFYVATGLSRLEEEITCRVWMASVQADTTPLRTVASLFACRQGK